MTLTTMGIDTYQLTTLADSRAHGERLTRSALE